jgi:hypothetical protein
MTLARLFPAASPIVALLFSIACSGPTNTNGSGTVTPSAEARPSSPSTASAPQIELTGETLAAFERGLRREIEAVRAAQQRSADAKTAQERGEAIQASLETVTIAQGAEAAGLPVERYRSIRQTVVETFRTLDFQGKIDGPLSMDLSRADDATKQRLARDPFEALTPPSAAALRAHMDRLVPVWIEYVNLTAVAG